MRTIAILLSLILWPLSHGEAQAATIADKTAAEIAREMMPGWNLGNTLEGGGGNTQNYKNSGTGTETWWQGTKTTKAVIDYVKQQGFRSVRIPCAWVMGHISNASDYTIDPAWMTRVKEIVDYCIDDGLYVVLNDHWDGGWLEENISATGTTKEKNKAVLAAIWKQIAEEFRDYDEHLLFAGLNEPGVNDNDGKNATLGKANTALLVEYEQVFINTVRETGGNNATRCLVVQGPSTDIDKTCNYMTTMPTDTATDRLMIEVHYYAPWQFWGMENDESWGKVFYYWGVANHLSGSTHNANHSEEAFMKTQLQKMKTNFADKGYAVVIGEYGANWRDISSLSGESQEKHDASIRLHYKLLNQYAMEMGMVPMAWDINAPNRDGKKGIMTILNRKTLTVFGTPMMDGIHEAMEAVGISITNGISTPFETAVARGTYDLSGRKTSSSSRRGVTLSKGRKHL